MMKSTTSIFYKAFAALTIVMLALAALPVGPAFAAACTFTSNATGNWNAAIWTIVGSGCGAYPGQTFAGDTVIIADGNTVSMNVSPAQTIASLQVGQGTSGQLTVGSGNGNFTLTVTGNVTVNAGATLTSTGNGGNILNLLGNLTNNNIFTDNAGDMSVRFNGTNNQTISGSGANTSFTTLLINNSGSSGNNIVDVTSTNFTTPTGFLTLTDGVFKLSTGATITPFAADTNLGAAVGFIVNHASAVVNWGNNDLVVTGGDFQMLAGAFNLGTGNDLLGISSGTMTLSGGTLSILGRIQMTGGTTTINGATVNIDPQAGANLGNTLHIFEAQGASNVTFTSGTVTIIDPHSTANAAGNAVQIVSGGGSKNFAGSTIQLGDGVSTTAGSADGFDVNCGTVTLGNLVINNTATNIATRFVRLITNNCTLGGNFTITDGEFQMNSLNLNVAGNFTNNDTFTPGTAGTVTMNGSAAQALGGTSATTFYNFAINNSSGVTLGNNITVNNTLTFTSGRITTGANRVILPVTTTATGSNTSYVNGNVRRAFTSGSPSFTFPIGDATNFASVALTFTGAGAGPANVDASVTNAACGSPGINQSANVNHCWTLTNGGVTFTNYNATFNFQGVGTDADGGSNTAAYIVGKDDAGTWTYPTVGTRTATSTQATGMTTMSSFEVGEVSGPTITSATYNYSTGVLVVTGANLVANGGGSDIDASTFTLTGDGGGGAAYTLTDTADVEIDSTTQFTLTLSATDKAAVNQRMNKNGTTSVDTTTYNLAGAANWDTGVATSADSTNPVTVSNVPTPAITSATYNVNTGVLVVTGTGLLSASGSDIVANKFTFTGQGAGTYNLTDTSNVEITSSTSFTLTLSATDKAAVNLLLNKNGTSSIDATVYNLAAAVNWNANAPADLTANGITVSGLNTAPVLDNTKTPVLNSELEDAGSPSGAVGTLITSLVDIGGALSNVTDPDAGAVTGIAVTDASTTNGSWQYSIDNGTNWSPLGAVANNSARLLAADANTRIYFVPNANFNGTVSPAITFRAWDQTSGTNGNLGDTSTNGGTTAFSTATDTANITITAVNDEPDFTASDPSAVDEDSGAQSVSSWVTAVDFGPADEDSSQAVSQYIISNSTCGTLLSAGPAVSTPGTLTYTPASNQNGSCTFDVQVQDNGGTANGGDDTSQTHNFTITVNAVNDPPTGGNESVTTSENTQIVFAAGDFTNYNDLDGDSLAKIEVTSDVSVGSLKCGGFPIITFPTTCDIGSLTFDPVTNENGTPYTTFGFKVNDGTISSTASYTMTINVDSINDPPINTVPGAQNIPVNAILTFNSGNSNLISTSDVDAGSADLEVALTVTNGTFSLSGTTGLSFSTGDGTDDTTMTFTGSLTNINAALDGLTFTPTTNFVGTATLDLTVNDQGNTGTGGPESDNDTVDINVGSVPKVVDNGINTNPDTGDGVLTENELVPSTLNVTQIIVTFDQDVYDPAGDSDQDDVTNPLNYLLVRSATGSFNTIDCANGPVAPDIQIAVSSVTYDNNSGAGPFVATVNLASALTTDGYYKLLVCGTTSIVSENDITIALAGNGTNSGTDFERNFQINTPATNGGGNENGGGGNNGGNNSSVALPSALPATGFAPGVTTILPAQPESMKYAATDVWLEIPSLKVSTLIVGVPLVNENWNLFWLGNDVGWLEGTAFPSWNGNSVLTGHVTNFNGQAGVFANLANLAWGDQVIVHAYGYAYTFEVRENKVVSPYSVYGVITHEESPWLTLITCKDYNDKKETYSNRVSVRAVLVSALPDTSISASGGKW